MTKRNTKLRVFEGAVLFLLLVFGSSSFADELKMGKMIYQSSCLQCHGERGDGNGPEAVNYDPRPTNFASSQMSALTDPMIEKAVVVGIPALSTHTWGTRLSNAEVAAVIRYIRAF